jgi:hypothetical protein
MEFDPYIPQKLSQYSSKIRRDVSKILAFFYFNKNSILTLLDSYFIHNFFP